MLLFILFLFIGLANTQWNNYRQLPYPVNNYNPWLSYPTWPQPMPISKEKNENSINHLGILFYQPFRSSKCLGKSFK